MNLLLWQVIAVACFAKLVFCEVVESSFESTDVMRGIKHTEPSECAVSNPRISTYLPHPEDCSQFYMCINKVPYLKKCPKGLHFNVQQKACDYPESAGCDEDAAEKVKGRNIKDNLEDCPEKNSKFPVYLPDPDDCSRFFICDNGIPHPKKCHPGLHFYPEIKACDFPKNAKCDADADDKAKGRITDENEGECPKENSIFPVYLPHPDDCSKFFICDNGSPNLKKCLPGLHFNPKLNACDFPENVGCGPDERKGRIGEDSLGMCRAEDSTVPEHFPHPDDCNKFYTCSKGLAVLQKCPPGLHFNQKLNICDFPEKAECETVLEMMPAFAGIQSPFCPSVEGKMPIFYRHPTNCTVYYMCSNGLAYEFVCPARLHFNLRKRICDYEENARCKT